MNRLVLPVVLGLTISAPAFAQPLPPAKGLSIERLYSFPNPLGRSPAAPAMSPDGTRIVFGWNQTGERRLDLWMMEYPSGEKRRIVEASSIQDLPRQDDTRTELEKKEEVLYDAGISGAVWSPDSKEFLFNYKGRTFRMDRDGKAYEPVFEAAVGAFGFQYTPDGRFLLYRQGTNLFRMDRTNGRIRQLTFLSRPNTGIGEYVISPDSKSVAVSWSDSSKLGNHVMMDFSRDRASVVNIRRMWSGERSVDSQIGLIPIDGGIVKWVPEIPRYNWGKGIEWSPDSKSLLIGWFKEDFKEFTLSLYDVATNKKTDIFNEKAPSNYVNDFRPFEWTRDGKILLGTDIRNGQWANRGLLRMNADGTNQEWIYREFHDIGALHRPKNSDRIILVTAGRTPLTADITILEPNGRRKVHTVIANGYSTPRGFNWAELPLVSDDGKSIATLASARNINPELYAVEPEMRRLTVSQTPEAKKIQWADFEEVKFPGPDGRMIHGLLIKRPGLDTTKKYPAVISGVYADSAKANWGGFVENYLASELDMVVLVVDFRSSWGYGGDFNSGYYRKMGLIDTEEAVSAKRFLVSLGYVRPDRVGIWGWSYGGFLTCMALLTKPGEFHAGVAVASVTDWTSYNEWYTRRRIGLPSEAAEFFKTNSPVHYASGLKDNLLLVHGMLDDNVLFQDTARLMQRLIEAGKYFEVMPYPRDDHSIGREGSRAHVYATIVRYLHNKLSQP